METKKELKFFSIAKHKEEEQYLRQQHQAGWKFIKVSGLGVYHFEKCQPEDVVYQLDYNQEGSANKAEYIKMFSDCGWDYLQEYFGFSYFRKPAAEMNGEEEIFSDSSSRQDMMKRVYMGRVLPLLAIFFAILLPQFISNLVRGNYGIVIVLGAMIMLYIVVFSYFGIRYYKMKK